MTNDPEHRDRRKVPLTQYIYYKLINYRGMFDAAFVWSSGHGEYLNLRHVDQSASASARVQTSHFGTSSLDAPHLRGTFPRINANFDQSPRRRLIYTQKVSGSIPDTNFPNVSRRWRRSFLLLFIVGSAAYRRHGWLCHRHGSLNRSSK